MARKKSLTQLREQYARISESGTSRARIKRAFDAARRYQENMQAQKSYKDIYEPAKAKALQQLQKDKDSSKYVRTVYDAMNKQKQIDAIQYPREVYMGLDKNKGVEGNVKLTAKANSAG